MQEESNVKAYPMSHGIMSPECIHEHMHIQFHIRTTIQILCCVEFIAPASCYLLHKLLFAQLSQHLFLILYYVIKAA